MTIDECRIKEFYLFYLLKRAERSLRLVGIVAPAPRRATSTIRQSTFLVVSYEGGGIRELNPDPPPAENHKPVDWNKTGIKFRGQLRDIVTAQPMFKQAAMPAHFSEQKGIWC